MDSNSLIRVLQAVSAHTSPSDTWKLSLLTTDTLNDDYMADCHAFAQTGCHGRSLLMNAARTGSAARVDWLLNDARGRSRPGMNKSATDADLDGLTALDHGVLGESAGVVGVLLSSARWDADRVTSSLKRAVKLHVSGEIIRLLLNAAGLSNIGDDLWIDNNRASVLADLGVDCCRPPVDMASRSDRCDARAAAAAHVLQTLLDAWRSPTAEELDQMVFYAAEWSGPLVRVLIAGGVATDRQYADRYHDPLHSAVDGGCGPALAALLDGGFSPLTEYRGDSESLLCRAA